MILGPISLIDCLVFLVFLAPQLLLQVGVSETLQCIATTLPFLVTTMPYQLVHERYIAPNSQRSPFSTQASLFQDLVIRCVRFAFANISASIGAVFFSKPVALPFMRWRMLRHGFLRSPVSYEEVTLEGKEGGLHTKGIWIGGDYEDEAPDLVIYYLHGGGFSMGSSYFYLEILMGLIALLRSRSKPDGKGAIAKNPALFALEYTLVPTSTYPTQLHETRRGYEFVMSKVQGQDPSRVVVAGDSAGATLVLSLLLDLVQAGGAHDRKPGFATLISPWCELVSSKNRDTPSDYLNADSLHMYARQYVGAFPTMGAEKREKEKGATAITDPVASPGNCMDTELWRRAAPTQGFHFVMGREEVFAPNARKMIQMLKRNGTTVKVTDKEAQIHAWPVVSLFLKDKTDERLEGMYDIVDRIGECMSL